MRCVLGSGWRKRVGIEPGSGCEARQRGATQSRRFNEIGGPVADGVAPFLLEFPHNSCTGSEHSSDRRDGGLDDSWML